MLATIYITLAIHREKHFLAIYRMGECDWNCNRRSLHSLLVGVYSLPATCYFLDYNPSFCISYLSVYGDQIAWRIQVLYWVCYGSGVGFYRRWYGQCR